MQFDTELIQILDKYSHSEWREGPLDGDEADRLVNILRNDLNLLNGNLTR